MADREVSKVVRGRCGCKTFTGRVGKKYFNLCACDRDNGFVFRLWYWIYCMVEVMVCNCFLQGTPFLVHLSPLQPKLALRAGQTVRGNGHAAYTHAQWSVEGWNNYYRNGKQWQWRHQVKSIHWMTESCDLPATGVHNHQLRAGLAILCTASQAAMHSSMHCFHIFWLSMWFQESEFSLPKLGFRPDSDQRCTGKLVVCKRYNYCALQLSLLCCEGIKASLTTWKDGTLKQCEHRY